MEKLKSNFCRQPCQLKNQIVMMPQPWLKSKVARKGHIHTVRTINMLHGQLNFRLTEMEVTEKTGNYENMYELKQLLLVMIICN